MNGLLWKSLTFLKLLDRRKKQQDGNILQQTSPRYQERISLLLFQSPERIQVSRSQYFKYFHWPTQIINRNKKHPRNQTWIGKKQLSHHQILSQRHDRSIRYPEINWYSFVPGATKKNYPLNGLVEIYVYHRSSV